MPEAAPAPMRKYCCACAAPASATAATIAPRRCRNFIRLLTILLVERRAPAIAPAALRLVELAPSALGRPAVLDAVRGFGRVAALLGGALALGDAVGRFFVQLLGNGRGTTHRRQAFHDDDAPHLSLAQRDDVAGFQFAR